MAEEPRAWPCFAALAATALLVGVPATTLLQSWQDPVGNIRAGPVGNGTLPNVEYTSSVGLTLTFVIPLFLAVAGFATLDHKVRSGRHWGPLFVRILTLATAGGTLALLVVTPWVVLWGGFLWGSILGGILAFSGAAAWVLPRRGQPKDRAGQ